MREEIWRPISEYGGSYEVSALGRVKSVMRTIVRSDGSKKTIRERILRPRINNVGYKYVNLLLNGKSKSKTVHKLVAIEFVPNPKNKPCIDHINGDRTDNRAENLRWCTYKENQNYEIARLRKQKQMTKVEQRTTNGAYIKTFDSISDAEKETGASHANICACCNGRRNYAGGYAWNYV